MYTEKDVYQAFRRVQSQVKDRPYKMPNDWNSHWENKFKPTERETIRKMTRYLATTWQNVDIYRYFNCGFELWKNFSYHQWFRPQVINAYIQKSKTHKRLEEDVKISLVDSAKFVKLYCKENNINLRTYARKRDGFELICIRHYIEDKISKWFMCFLIYRNYCIMEKSDWERIESIGIGEKIIEMKVELRELGGFLNGISECFE